jgi:hypothetical protein
MALPPLATDEDVAAALGVAEASELPQSMQIRMDATLAKVSRRFRMEAERIFTPGVYAHTLRINAGAVRLMEVPSGVHGVRIEGLPQLDWGTVDVAEVSGGGTGDPVVPPPELLVEKQWLRWEDWYYWRLSGRMADVCYSWDLDVPADVVACVADIAARVLSVDPLSSVVQSKSLVAGDFRQDVADWVLSANVGFSSADIELARSYRYPVPPSITARLTSMNEVPAQWFSDSSWG